MVGWLARGDGGHGAARLQTEELGAGYPKLSCYGSV